MLQISAKTHKHQRPLKRDLTTNTLDDSRWYHAIQPTKTKQILSQHYETVSKSVNGVIFPFFAWLRTVAHQLNILTFIQIHSDLGQL